MLRLINKLHKQNNYKYLLNLLIDWCNHLGMETEPHINNLIFQSEGLISIKEKSSILPHLFRKTKPFNHLEFCIRCHPNINPNNSKNSQNKVNRINRTNREILIKDQLKVNLLFKVNKKSNSKIKANLNKI